MKRIASFEIDHDVLTQGLYLSRVDGDVRTFDLRFVRPNTPPFLPPPVMHTIEHLIATYVRNSEYTDNIVYFGPMGCRTGFYFLCRELTDEQVIALLVRALTFTSAFEGEIPGSTARECGNYLEHDLAGAREACAAMVSVLEHWTSADLVYPQA